MNDKTFYIPDLTRYTDDQLLQEDAKFKRLQQQALDEDMSRIGPPSVFVNSDRDYWTAIRTAIMDERVRRFSSLRKKIRRKVYAQFDLLTSPQGGISIVFCGKMMGTVQFCCELDCYAVNLNHLPYRREFKTLENAKKFIAIKLGELRER